MKTGFAICVTLVTAVISSSAFAEPPLGSRLGDRYETREVKQDRERAAGAHEIANCLVGKKSREVHAYLSTTSAPESYIWEKKLGVVLEDCFLKRPTNDLVEGERITFPPAILRGMLAEELIKQDMPAFVRLPSLPIQKTYARAWYAGSSRDRSVNEMATCVADTNPEGVAALLNAEPYTEAEDSAFSTMVPFMGPCLSAGTKLSGDKEPLRAALAEALYQRVNLPADSSVTKPELPQ